MHIAFNMYALYSFGSILERVWGWRRFLFYMSAGFGAALIHQIATGVEAYMLLIVSIRSKIGEKCTSQ